MMNGVLSLVFCERQRGTGKRPKTTTRHITHQVHKKKRTMTMMLRTAASRGLIRKLGNAAAICQQQQSRVPVVATCARSNSGGSSSAPPPPPPSNAGAAASSVKYAKTTAGTGDPEGSGATGFSTRGPVTWPALGLVAIAAASAVSYYKIERERRLENAMGKIVSDLGAYIKIAMISSAYLSYSLPINLFIFHEFRFQVSLAGAQTLNYLRVGNM